MFCSPNALTKAYPGFNLHFCTSILILALFASCKFNPNIQGKGEAMLQGTWEEGTIAYEAERLQYSQHKFRFSCDSVFVTIKSFSKVKTNPDSCFNNGQWTEYAKGVYQTKKDTLLITATFTKANFKQKISGCYRVGQYLPRYVIRKVSIDTLNLEDLQNHLPLTLGLKQKEVCNQKPLN